MKKETKRIIRGISVILFLAYLVLMMYVLFFAESLGRTYAQREYTYNLHLFREIRRFWVYRSQLGTEAVLLNLAGNVLCFVPFGTILPILSGKARNFFVTFLLSFGFSFAVETVQFLTKTGSFDVDDLLLNTMGGVIGFLFFTFCNILRRKQYG